LESLGGSTRMYDHVVKCQRAGLCLSEHFLIIVVAVISISPSWPSIIMRPSSIGGGRILRRTLSVCPSVRPSRDCLL